MHDNFSFIQVNHILRVRSISHCVDIRYVFLYLIFRAFMFVDAIKTVNAAYHIYTFVIILNSYLGSSFLIPCSSSDACSLLFNANYSACKLIID